MRTGVPSSTKTERTWPVARDFTSTSATASTVPDADTLSSRSPRVTSAVRYRGTSAPPRSRSRPMTATITASATSAPNTSVLRFIVPLPCGLPLCDQWTAKRMLQTHHGEVQVIQRLHRCDPGLRRGGLGAPHLHERSHPGLIPALRDAEGLLRCFRAPACGLHPPRRRRHPNRRLVRLRLDLQDGRFAARP